MNDPRGERNRIAAEAVGISVSIGPLVMELDDRQMRRKKRNRSQNARADDGVRANQFEFRRGQRRLLAQHLVGHADLADVVQQGAEPQRGEIRIGQLERPSHFDRQRAHALGMTSGVRIAGIERRRQSMDGAEIRGLRLGFGLRQEIESGR